jgi:hypothetical protein
MDKERGNLPQLTDLAPNGEKSAHRDKDKTQSSTLNQLDFLKAIREGLGSANDNHLRARMELQKLVPAQVSYDAVDKLKFIQLSHTCHQTCNPGVQLQTLKDIDDSTAVKKWCEMNAKCNTPAWLVMSLMTQSCVEGIALRLSMRKDSLNISDTMEDFLNWDLYNWWDHYERFLAPSKGSATLDHANKEVHMAAAKSYVDLLPRRMEETVIKWEEGLDLSSEFENVIRGLRLWEKGTLPMENFLKVFGNQKIVVEYLLMKLYRFNSTKMADIISALRAADEIEKIVSFKRFYSVITRHLSSIVAAWLKCKPYLRFPPSTLSIKDMKAKEMKEIGKQANHWTDGTSTQAGKQLDTAMQGHIRDAKRKHADTTTELANMHAKGPPKKVKGKHEGGKPGPVSTACGHCGHHHWGELNPTTGKPFCYFITWKHPEVNTTDGPWATSEWGKKWKEKKMDRMTRGELIDGTKFHMPKPGPAAKPAGGKGNSFLSTIQEIENYFITTSLLHADSKKGGKEVRTPLKTGFIDTGAFTHSFLSAKRASKLVKCVESYRLSSYVWSFRAKHI